MTLNISHDGMVSVQEAGYNLMNDLQSNGFNLIFPAAGGVNAATTKAVFEASTVDPLSTGDAPNKIDPQRWRICIDTSYTGAGTPAEAANSYMRIYMGTPNQIRDDGTVTDEYSEGGTVTTIPAHPDPNDPTKTIPAQTVTGPSTVRKSGELSAGVVYPSGSAPYASTEVPFFCYDGTDLTKHFGQTITNPQAHPLSSSLTVTDHGISYFIWVEAQDVMGDKFSWFCVQRLVDAVTGSIPPHTIASKWPVFCLFSVGGGDPENPVLTPTLTFSNVGLPTKMPNIWKMVVRETDVNRPVIPVNACLPTPDNSPIINAHQQVSIYENQTFSLTMPANFNTARYKYKEEMDLILYTSADVISTFNTVTLSMFGKTRIYQAMQANLPDNSGMRILQLVSEA